MRYEVPSYLRIDEAKTAKAIIDFIRNYVSDAGASGVVLGLSGGTDSSVLAALAVEALSADRVAVLFMYDKESSLSSERDAELLASLLNLKLLKLDLTTGVEFVLKLLGDSYEVAPRVAKGNVKARLRMVVLYYLANKTNSLVLGSSDRSEWLIGYFTKWGDGAADLYPLINLYKTQVRLLGDYLGLPERICWKPSSPDLWPGHRAVDELGVEYDVIDSVLHLYVDRGLGAEEVSKIARVDLNTVKNIISRIPASEHKRRFTAGPQPVPKL
ncbi:MAG: NAD+ synthase [Sulfolobales archaeon]|nr:NAD+ synthase [Sulfolobales archaeon]MCX8209007.1 NAD+ synthase [Sulfolobales archaeon]MDW8010021.1 NAD+ synthase [Sulfolobales archaeon]